MMTLDAVSFIGKLEGDVECLGQCCFRYAGCVGGDGGSIRGNSSKPFEDLPSRIIQKCFAQVSGPDPVAEEGDLASAFVSSSVARVWGDSGCQDLVFTQGPTVGDLMIQGHVLPSHVLLTSSEYVLAQTTKKRGAVC